MYINSKETDFIIITCYLIFCYPNPWSYRSVEEFIDGTINFLR